MIDGEIIDISKRDRKASPTTMEDSVVNAILTIGRRSKKDSEVKPAGESEEEIVELMMNKWVELEGLTAKDLMCAASISEEILSEIEAIGLETLISIYCTAGEKFAAKIFKEELRSMEVPMLICSKLYMGLQKWRRSAVQYLKSNSDYITPLSDDGTPQHQVGALSPITVTQGCQVHSS